MTTLRSFIAANPSAALLLLLISILTWSSCSLASPFTQPDTTAVTELSELVAAEEIQHSEKGSSDGVAGTRAAVTTTGTCKAILPDGRLQTVVYTCAPTGYSAVVQFHKAGNQSATHERNQTNTNNTPADATTQQQPLQPITEVLFLRPTTTTDDSSARVITTTTTAESPSITTSSTPTKKPESMAAIVPPHRFHIETDQIRKVSLVQLQHSLPSLPLSTTTPAAKRNRSTTTVLSAAVDDESPATTPAAATGRKRINKTRWNIGGAGSIQSDPPL